jgi:hypothetical protein
MPQIIGTAVLDTVAAIKARHGEQTLAKILGQLNGEAKHLFNAPIESWKWYSLDAFVDLLDADVRETAHGDRTVLVERSKKVVDAQLRGVDNLLTDMDSPKFVITRVAIIHQSYFEGIQIIPEIEEGPRATIKYIGLQKNHDILEPILIGFYIKALEICGARDISARFTLPISQAAPYSEITITWA